MQLEQSQFKENAGGINSCIVDGCLPVKSTLILPMSALGIGRTVAFLDAQ